MSNKLEVQSEIFRENTNSTSVSSNTLVTTSFNFKYPPDFPYISGKEAEVDEDGDLLVCRRPVQGVIKIEHSLSTPLATVGLQVWRGALLLADFILHHGMKTFLDKNVLEVGAGMGLTSIVASIFAKRVVATDVDIGGILALLKKNFDANKALAKSCIQIFPLNFYERNWNFELEKAIKECNIILAADVIYDNDVTEEFVKSIEKMLSTPKILYICLERRYVFTLDDLDTVAPCYEHFWKYFDQTRTKPSNKSWMVEQVPLDFPQYFQYDRNKHLILWKITKP
ncbi:unnamed protein product [Bemisia tabaci]|uniref:Methyltransferase-like protein 22 n=1 Tax=Bemisia tabaci TaxID=7038 RepID=A0A9P0AHA5_BEMTA|nr:unnamed protein product [Bemisia tabaci]